MRWHSQQLQAPPHAGAPVGMAFAAHSKWSPPSTPKEGTWSSSRAAFVVGLTAFSCKRSARPPCFFPACSAQENHQFPR